MPPGDTCGRKGRHVEEVLGGLDPASACVADRRGQYAAIDNTQLSNTP